MPEISVTIQNGTEVRARLTELENAAAVFGASTAQVVSNSAYARYVTDGTRPHMIYPRAKRALFWPGAAHPVTRVQHPGTKPQPFLEQALASVNGTVETFVADQLAMVATGGGSNYSAIMPAAARIVLEAAQQDAPVRTGDLRRSLHTVVA